MKENGDLSFLYTNDKMEDLNLYATSKVQKDRGNCVNTFAK